MTDQTNRRRPTSGDVPAAEDATADLQQFLNAYRPGAVPAAVWASIAGSANYLVLRAGELSRRRVEKDIGLIGAVIAHQLNRGRPTTLEDILTDATLADFDATLVGQSPKTRERKRGILRRLQAVHHGLPWRDRRRPDGERIQSLVPHTIVDDFARVIADALAAGPADRGAAALLRSVKTARLARRHPRQAAPPSDEADWSLARRYALERGFTLTRHRLHAALTHELLRGCKPVVALIDTHGLTRRDLELALTHAVTLPAIPASAHCALLRGQGEPPPRAGLRPLP